jgi:hypothetical protein
MDPIGKTTWLIPDMYWPEITSQGHYVSHESICVLNTSDEDCRVELILYFEDRKPVSGLSAVCAAQRTNHIRMDRLVGADGKHIPRGVPYAAVVNAAIPVVVQYTRVDTTQSANSIMTTMAYPLS